LGRSSNVNATSRTSACFCPLAPPGAKMARRMKARTKRRFTRELYFLLYWQRRRSRVATKPYRGEEKIKRFSHEFARINMNQDQYTREWSFGQSSIGIVHERVPIFGSVVSVEISGKFGFSALIRVHPR